MPDVVTTTDPGQSAAPATPAPSSAPVVDSAAPVAPAVPANAAPASEPAPVVPAADASAAPSAPAGDSATPAPAKTDDRVAHAQRMMHAATSARAELERQLRDLGHVPVTQPGQPVSAGPPAQPQAQPQQPSVQATPQASQTSRFTLDPAMRKDLFAKYQAAPDDEQAYGSQVEEIVNLVMSKVPTLESVVANRQIMDRIYGDFNHRIRTETQQTERDNATIAKMNGFFATHAPGVPQKLIWQYADEAVRMRPWNPQKPPAENLADQGLYMLEKALGDVGPLLDRATTTAQTTQALAQGQSAVLPGGSGLPTAGGGEGQPLSLVEQLRRANQGI